MRVRAAVLALVAFAAIGCEGDRTAIADRDSLGKLTRLTAERNDFGVILDAQSGKALASFRVDNPIRTAIPDGDGGWYVGGGFVRVDGVLRKRLAHIGADGTLDRAWKPEANGNGVSVTALARIGSRLYVAGDFARLQHAPRFHFGALDAETGRLDSTWRPRPRQPLANEVLLAAGNRLIAGGRSCCSEAGSSVMALDARTGTPDPTWKPHVGPTTLYGSGVYLLASNGRGVLVRGLFGRGRGRVTAGEIDPRTGALAHKWRPRAAKDCLWCILMAAAIGDDRVFASVNGSASNDLVAFSRRSGATDRAWHARLSSAAGFYGATSAYTLATSPGRVYVAGDFDRVNGARRNGFAALDPDTAAVLPAWQPRAPTVYGTVLARSRSRLLVGVELSPQVRFDFTGLKTYRPVRRLRLVLGLSGAGDVRIGVGRNCDYEQWVSVTGRCPRPVDRWLGTVRFGRAGRKSYTHDLSTLEPGPHFIRFVPRAGGGKPQRPLDFWFRVR